jgi:uroporphyrinogen III methyltransferase/synthase
VPRAVQGSRDLDNILDKYNIDYKDIPIYDVSGRMTQKIKYLEDLDYLVFVSASGVTAFFEELRKERLSLPKGIKLACIGNITRQRLLQEYGEADVVATVNDVNGLIDAIKIQR